MLFHCRQSRQGPSSMPILTRFFSRIASRIFHVIFITQCHILVLTLEFKSTHIIKGHEPFEFHCKKCIVTTSYVIQLGEYMYVCFRTP